MKKINIDKKWLIISGILISVIQNFAWLPIGEKLDDKYTNFVAWHVIPSILPLIIAVILFSISIGLTKKQRFIKSAIFIASYYVGWFIFFILLIGSFAFH